MIITSKWVARICVCGLPVIFSCSTAIAAEERVDDILFLFVEKVKNYQQSEAGELTLADYGFLAAVFGSGKGKIESADVTLPGSKRAFALEDTGRMYAFGKGQYGSIETLNAEFPDGEYHVSVKSEHNAIVNLPLNLLGKGEASDYPPAPTVELSQDGVKARWQQIDPAKDLTLGWTPFSTGKVDPRKLLDDMVIVLTDDCKGDVVGSSGLPFTDRYLTFSDNSYTIKAGALKPGAPYTFRVEHIRTTDTARQGNVPGLAVYMAITAVNVHTTGAAVDAACSPIGGDPATGKDKATACTACHGPRGSSTNSLWPHLAAQSEAYIVSQLKAFKDGSRVDPLMTGQVGNLSEQDMKDIAAYFFAQKPPIGTATPELAGAGEAVYRTGNAESGVPACKDCHGPAGVGNAATAYLRLAGQHADYVAIQLRSYRDGKRSATADAKMMSAMAAKLTDEEIIAVASYLSALH